ncbi:TRAP transporter substrate-binding protein DctP [Jiella pelagia]|uniref:TRAP transporter substrate-binding protein DctP n=1 Tax=Jiella pelagia TaxID=2986949 RepID=A0ABY7C4N0_9HYPH|nr:TRAP transporter substrate-binding protein DctP [Jiella pelagia]WAP69733.1 TRAP transporter substrate-binding protein DctP [Jiella pelagia]
MRLYTALQTGVVDGQENALDTIATMKYNEVQKNLLVSGHGANEDVVLFNPAWWNSLPEKYQTVIVEAFEEVRPKVEAIKEASQDKALKTLKDAGMNVREAHRRGAPDDARADVSEGARGLSRPGRRRRQGDRRHLRSRIREGRRRQVIAVLSAPAVRRAAGRSFLGRSFS